MPSTTSSILASENFGFNNPDRPSAWEEGFSPRLPVEADFHEKPKSAHFGDMKRAHREAVKKREEEARRDMAEYRFAIQQRKERHSEDRARGYTQAHVRSRAPMKSHDFCGEEHGKVHESEYEDEMVDSEREDDTDYEADYEADNEGFKDQSNNKPKARWNGDVKGPKVETEVTREVMNDISPTKLHNGTNTPNKPDKSDKSKAAAEKTEKPKGGKRGWIGWVLISEDEDENENGRRQSSSEQDLGQFGRGKRRRTQDISYVV